MFGNEVEERTTDLSTANRLLQAASKVSKIAITILEPEDLLYQAVNLIQEHFDCYYVGLFLVDDARRYAVLHAGTGVAGAEMLRRQHKLALADNSMIGWCINHAQARIALDVELEATRFANPLLPDTHSEMALPLSARGETIGALTIQSVQNNAFSAQDITVLQAMADHLATAIANAHLYEAAQLEIAERKRAEREREALIAELERFTYTVSHDLKSPLITIKGFLGYLEQDIASGKADRIHSDINRIANAADTMRDLLNDLLELSRVGRVSNPPEVISMNALAREAVEIVAGQLAAYSVHVDIAPDMPEVYGDRSRLREVWQNLLSNAAKFMGDQPHPRIEVGAQAQNGETVYFVRDNGIGINPRDHDTVFGLFEKLDSNSEGTGIGLTIVKRIIETHGGHIWVESEGVGHGSTFCFTLSFS
ncbi:MAG: GAF domain-containing sensor histidine kinase [Anaerolineae bacterium]|nr:GAF domain-containing sensor histidine kinase [Anaerolineae bacterium]